MNLRHFDATPTRTAGSAATEGWKGRDSKATGPPFGSFNLRASATRPAAQGPAPQRRMPGASEAGRGGAERRRLYPVWVNSAVITRWRCVYALRDPGASVVAVTGETGDELGRWRTFGERTIYDALVMAGSGRR
jgi:hypothetical protein